MKIFPFLTRVYSIYWYIYRGINTKITETTHISSYIQLKLNLVKVLVCALKFKVTINEFTAEVQIALTGDTSRLV